MRDVTVAAPDIVLFIHGGSQVDSQTSALLRQRLLHFGYSLDEFSVNEPDALSRLRSFLHEHGARTFCFMSSNFWALNIIGPNGALLHTLTGIPLVIMLHDHPIHFVTLATEQLNDAITFAIGEDTADFIAKHFSYRTKIVSNPAGPSITLDRLDVQPNFEDFKKRHNALLCPMNLTVEQGDNIDDVWSDIKSLPAARRARTQQLIERSLTDCSTPLHIIAEGLPDSGQAAALEDLLPALNFVKLWRRTRIVEMLIELPVLFSSNYVPSMLERRYPEKFTLLSVPETIALYGKYRFVVNSTPLLNEIVHDRVTQALHNNCVCVTDSNALLARYFTDGEDMLFIDYENTAVVSRIEALLSDPERAFQMTVNCRRVWSATSFSQTAYEQLLQAVQERRASMTANEIPRR